MNCERQIPYAEADRQALDSLESLVRDPNWAHGRSVEVVIVEVSGNRGYNWFEIDEG